MKLFLRLLLSVGGLIVGAAQVGAETRTLTLTLTRAHAHNDYAHPRPLFDALDAHFGSIEADVFLVDGKLLVAHERKALTAAKTLEALYLEPLRARIAANNGSVYGDGVGVTLLIDVKTEAGATYAALHQVLARYAELLTRYENGGVKPGAITVIISGNRARTAMEQAAVRYAAMDGRLGDLESPAPDTPATWEILDACGVDLINTDRLKELAVYLEKKRPAR